MSTANISLIVLVLAFITSAWSVKYVRAQAITSKESLEIEKKKEVEREENKSKAYVRADLNERAIYIENRGEFLATNVTVFLDDIVAEEHPITGGRWAISITMDTYSHVMPNMQKEAAQKLDNFLTVEK